ncbi:methionine gamma-lyase, partial [Candidatus Saccharibacteria bacterium]|nr:methionine gamma-lyase [Candidatus Saccharibacteria bacterium]NIW78305.1 methionine gamma-lyase [Calditrichia bacterium]
DHPKVEKVYYLGHLTEDDPQFPIYRKQCLSPGSMVSFDIVGEESHAFKFLNSLKF